MSIRLANTFEEVLHAFCKHGVDFMIVGGYAVVFHGYGRTTGDLDIWVSPDLENIPKIIAAFKQLEYPQKLLRYIKTIDFKKPFAIKIGSEPLQVDMFNAITGVEYADAQKRSIQYHYANGIEVRFIHLQDLIVNKMLTGRLKDAADVEQLHNINKYSTDRKTVSWLRKFFGKKDRK